MAQLYPTLEDMKVDHMVQAQQKFVNEVNATGRAIAAASGAPPGSVTTVTVLYPTLESYMGLQITSDMIQQYNQQPVSASHSTQVAHRSAGPVAPITGHNAGLQRAEVKQGIRQVTFCKDAKGSLGLRVRAVNKGVFVSLVHAHSPASLVGLRFGDQILQINGQDVAGWDTDKVIKFLKKALPERITMAIRDRPFERTVTLQKDSAGNLGFVFKDNKITAIVKDSSAARNGVLIEHHMVEVNGQNVVGMKEKEIKQIVDASGRTVTITIIPSQIFEHIMKNIGSSLVKKHMDHSIPDL